MKKTGVKITEEEALPLRELVTRARSLPVIYIKGISIADEAWKAAYEAAHAMALNRGLPEIKGYYGIDADNEFVTVD